MKHYSKSYGLYHITKGCVLAHRLTLNGFVSNDRQLWVPKLQCLNTGLLLFHFGIVISGLWIIPEDF